MAIAEKNSAPLNLFCRNVTLLVASSMTVLAGAIIAPTLPLLSEVFQNVEHSELLVKLILSTPAIFIAIFAPFSGYILDTYGRKKVFIFSLILYGIAGSSGYFVNNIYLIIAGRIFLGVGVAGIMTASTTLIGDYFTDKNRDKFLGLQSAFMAFGGMIFLILGGVLGDISWKAPFLVYAFSFILLPAVLIFIYEPDLDQEKNTTGKEMPERFSVKKYLNLYILAFMGMLILYMMPVHLPFMLKSLDDLSNTNIGLSFASFILVAGMTSIFYQKITTRITYRMVVIISLLLIGIGYILAILASNTFETMFYLTISAVGQGMFLPNLGVWLMSKAPVETRGRAVGGLTTCFFAGQFFCPIFTQPIVHIYGIMGCFAIAGGIALCMGVFFIFYKSN